MKTYSRFLVFLLVILSSPQIYSLPASYSVNYLPDAAVGINILGNYLRNESGKPVIRNWTDDTLIQQWDNTGDWVLSGTDLNDNNEVAATRSINNFGDINGAYRLDPGTTDPNAGSWVRFQPGETDAIAYGLNEAGIVVGEYREFAQSTPNGFSGNTQIDTILFPCCGPGFQGRSLAVSNNGLAVGFKEVNYFGNVRLHAFIQGLPGGIQSINALNGYPNGAGIAKDVNDNGLVIGEVTNSNFLLPTNRSPYIWDSQSNIFQLLPELPNGSSTHFAETIKINNQDIVIGVARDSNGNAQGVAWFLGERSNK